MKRRKMTSEEKRAFFTRRLERADKWALAMYRQLGGHGRWMKEDEPYLIMTEAQFQRALSQAYLAGRRKEKPHFPK